MSSIVDTNGRTGEQFLEETFEFEYCSCCGGDVKDHDAVPISLGAYGGVNFFARCKQETVNEERAS
jgi:hypothetical protein